MQTIRKARQIRNGGVSRFMISKCPNCGMTIKGRRDYIRHKEVAHNEKILAQKWYLKYNFL